MIALGNFFFKYRSLIFITMSAVLFLPAKPLFQNAEETAAWTGFIIALAGQLIRFVTIGYEYIVRGGRNRKVFAEGLVTGGMFAHCRNPMYLGNVLMVVGVGLVANSASFLLIIAPAVIFIYQAIILAEENYLQSKFGESYREYCREAGRWTLNLKNLRNTVQDTPFSWKRVLLKEHGTTFFLMVILFVIVVTRLHTNDPAYFYSQLPTVFLAGMLILWFYVAMRIVKKLKLWADA